MATKTLAYNPQTGATKPVAVGFSWTTLFFGAFPALFRADWLGFLIGAAIGLVTGGFGFVVWAFFYNGFHRDQVLNKGYLMHPPVTPATTPPPPPAAVMPPPAVADVWVDEHVVPSTQPATA